MTSEISDLLFVYDDLKSNPWNERGSMMLMYEPSLRAPLGNNEWWEPRLFLR